MSPEVFEQRCAEMRAKYAAISLREAQVRRYRKEEQQGTAQWDRTRPRSLWGIRRYGVVREPAPPTAKVPTLSEKRALFADRTTEELRLEETRMLLEIDQMRRLIPLLQSSVRNIRAELRIRETLQVTPRYRPSVDVEYPQSCERCGHERIIRAGFTTGRNQIFRCKGCNSTFTDHVRPRIDYKLVCHRCNGTDTENRGPGKQPIRGRQGFCFTCKKGFLQGGAAHLQQHYEALRQRIKATQLPADVQEEALQDAALRVLAGEGYVHSIELRKSAAYREARGEYGQRGSDHPLLRLHNDQPPPET